MTALTRAQRGIWAGHLLAEDRALYNTAEYLVFEGKVDARLLAAAVARVVAEAECLDSTYRAGPSGRGERARVGVPFPSRLPTYRLETANADPVRDAEEWAVAHDSSVPFDLEAERPCRFALLQGNDRDSLYMASHHVALDGFGYSLFWDRLVAVYSATLSGDPPPPCPFPPMSDAFGTDGGEASTTEPPEALAYWREKLLAHLRDHDSPHSPAGGTHETPLPARDPIREAWAMPAGLWAGLLAFSKAHGASWTDVILASVALLAAMRSGARKQLLGFPVLGRAGAQLRVPCMQMNIVPLPVSIGEADTLSSLSIRIAKERKESRRFHGCRHEAMQRDLRAYVPGARVFGPVVNVLPFPSIVASGNVRATRTVMSAGPVVDLTVVVRFESFAVPPVFEFLHPPGCAWDQASVPLVHDFEGLLSDHFASPDAPCFALVEDRMAKERAAALLTAPEPSLAREGSVIDWILEEARIDPGKVAIAQGNTRVTYGELARTTGRWAGALVARGLPCDAPVAAMLERTPRAVLALLAILRAGGTYVPMDPEGPHGRRDDIVGRVAPWTVLVDEVRGDFADGVLEIALGDLDACDAACVRAAAPEAACILFTSGSTGKPKGVVLGMNAIGRFTLAAQDRYRVSRSDTMLQFAPLHFDASLEEILVTLASGGTLLLRDAAMTSSLGAFGEATGEAGVTVLDLPTAFWNEWVEALERGTSRVPASVRTVILGGEAVAPAKLRRWFAAAPGVRLVNSYGPTEATIVATTADLGEEHAAQTRIPIGLPLSGVEALVLDGSNRPCQEGELVLLGPTLALRYLGSDAPLRVPLRVGTESRESYRTGDLVSCEGGEIRYLGRADGQLKVSGHRVHPGEVEAAFLRLPGVRDCCVVGFVDAKGRTRLAAFLVHDEGGELTGLRARLASALPHSLVPGVIEVVERLPKTSTGKVDRRALSTAVVAKMAVAPSPPSVESARWVAADCQGAAPVETSLVAHVQSAWSAELGLPPEGLDVSTDFFEAGGHSLLAIGISVRLAHALGREVLVTDVLKFPRLGDFCRNLSASRLRESDKPVRFVTLSRGGHGARRLLAFPGIGGGVEQFASLARELGDAFAIDVVQVRTGAFGSMGSLVEACVALLDEAGSPESPLRTSPSRNSRLLLGHSFGGRVAFEVARVLESHGEAPRLCLLDAYLHLDWSDEANRALRTSAPWMVGYKPTGPFGGATLRVYAEHARWYASEALERAKAEDERLFTPGGSARRSPGDHFSMLAPANAGALARIVRWI